MDQSRLHSAAECNETRTVCTDVFKPMQIFLSCRSVGRGIFCFALLVYLLTLNMAVQSKINYIGTCSSPTLSLSPHPLALFSFLTPSFSFSSLSSTPHLIQLGGLGGVLSAPNQGLGWSPSRKRNLAHFKVENVSAGSH